MTTGSAAACAICGNRDGTTHRVREMMFGTRSEFDYFRCDGCGCLQLVTDVDVATHYPVHYHAYQVQPRRTGLRGQLRRLRNQGVFGGNAIGQALNAVAPYPVPGAHRWFRIMGTGRQSRILDVGCGAAELLLDLSAAGFTKLTGVDPFLPDELLARLPSFVRKIGLSEVSGEFDVVMLHHVLEHMPDHGAALDQVSRVLRPGGYCLIRIPVIPSQAWERYREHWVQIDAPRHLLIHSEKSLAMAAMRAGLRLERIEYDSTDFQFAGSELYERDVPLTELATAYSRAEIRRFRREARRLNRSRRGDQAAFYFRKAG
jgi:SAM-dependent methyltransferase